MRQPTAQLCPWFLDPYFWDLGTDSVDEVRKGLISAPKQLKVSRLVACLFAEMNDRGWLARPREEERGRRTEGCLTFLLHLWTEWDLFEKCLLSWFKPNLEALRWRRTLLRTALRVRASCCKRHLCFVDVLGNMGGHNSPELVQAQPWGDLFIRGKPTALWVATA